MKQFNVRLNTCLISLTFGLLLIAAGCEKRSKSSVPPPLPPVQEGSIRVICWNLQWFPGRSPKAGEEERRKHIQDISSAIVDLKPDILLAQEVRSAGLLPKTFDGQSKLELTTTSKFPGAQQICIAASIPSEASWSERWQRDRVDDPPRGFAHAVFRLPSGKLLLVYTLHLKSNAGGSASSNRAKREDASRQLLTHLDEQTKIHTEQEGQPPAILIAGDFNTDPDVEQFSGERTLKMIEEAGFKPALQQLPRKKRITWPSNGRYPDASFDHVFVRGINTASISVPTSYDDYSDHRPIVIDLTTTKIPDPLSNSHQPVK